MFFVAVSQHHVSHVHVIDLSYSSKEDMFFVDMSRHHVTPVHAIDLSSSEGRHVLCCCVSASCFPCTCYRSFFLGKKMCSLSLCLGISCYPCTCYRSFFLGRKTWSLFLCLGIMFPMYML